MTDIEAPRPLLAADKTAPAAQHVIAGFHKDFVDEVAAAVARDHIVVVGMAQNPFVRRAHKALKKAGIVATRLDHGSYLGGYKRRLAIKMWSGYPTFPQVFVDGVLIGGCKELEAKIADGSLR
ncbi:MAG TPA: glutaredoxin [Myxococcota bacterium]